MTDLKVLKQLIRLMVENDLSELDVEQEGIRYSLKRGGGQIVPQMVAAAPVAAAAPGAGTGGAEAGAAAETGPTIDSPMVGTFYSAPSPDAKPFVSVGDAVSAGTVVCIIEAMKVFNEIKAEVGGVITRGLVNNGDAVEYGQPLYEIKPT